MSRVYNFSAGPAVLPEEVLKEVAEEMMDYQGSGMSVMEMSHRSADFQKIIDEAEQDLRDLMKIPDNYKVLFLQGGASQQFAAIPMNLMKNKVADYIVTGQWAKKAYQEAQKYGKANKIASSEDKTFSYIPDCSDLPISPDADYVYICENNTIYGTKFKKLPNTKGKTLVADVSSCFLSEPVDVSKYGIIYGGVQKNIGPAGMVISIIREDLITDDVLEGTPTMLKFKTQADAGSLYNTPNCYCIYVCGKVFKWLKKMGGLEEMQRRNIEKAKILYDFLDQSKLFKGTVVPEDRSLMNVPFVTPRKEQDADVVAASKAAGFDNLKGHKSVGGLRASIYNAMPKEGVEALVEFLKKYVPINLDDYIGVINVPGDDKPYGRMYAIQDSDQIPERRNLYLNVPMEELKGYVIDSLKDGEPVWFGSDVLQHCDRNAGVMDFDLYDLEAMFGVKFTMDKAQRFATHESLPTHAMTIAGVDIKDGKPTKWKIENSWGTENHGMKTGNNGYFVCSDEWFDNFVYEVAIRKDRLSPEMQKALDSDPIVWPFWNTFNPVSA